MTFAACVFVAIYAAMGGMLAGVMLTLWADRCAWRDARRHRLEKVCWLATFRHEPPFTEDGAVQVPLTPNLHEHARN